MSNKVKRRRRPAESLSPWLRMTANERRLLHESGTCWSECATCKEEEQTRGKCPGCDGPYPFEMSIPSALWNQVVRSAGMPDNLCPTCILFAFTRAGVSFSADLSGHGVWGASLTVTVFSQGFDTLKDHKRSRDGWGVEAMEREQRRRRAR